ncbi:MAG: EutN/CcmL family microcompartment protein [Candidatus Rokubacteria bacterium]|nr:EutN/CcmL family microcompartment protein [Candidatus Rokubacteria bacterium]
MILGRVIGTVWATHKQEKLTGLRFLVVELVGSGRGAAERGEVIVAMDALGCGRGEMVLVVQGMTAQKVVGDAGIPIDAAVVALVDRVDYGQGDRAEGAEEGPPDPDHLTRLGS